MGYCIWQEDGKFTIKRESFDAALAAIKAIKGSPSWTTSAFKKAKTLKEAFDDWRWNIEYTDTSDVTDIGFEGEKAGDDKLLFDAVAPFVEAGSFIEMSGEDGTRWRWMFDGKICKEKIARFVYDEDEDG